ncbi:MAG: ATP-binding protein, partial [Bacteroidia bacterium]|nr:ATP-binding protein [Bacteroidia bacterium]
MNLNTSLKGRLRNTNLPLTNVLYPLFEAVVNSIHSIDTAMKLNSKSSTFEGIITIRILRSSQVTNYSDIKPDIIGFEILDNGVGFNTDNYNSFQTLDSEYKIALGCRGVGRLLWLKAFDKVTVKSVYEENRQLYSRTFDFTAANDILNENV